VNEPEYDPDAGGVGYLTFDEWDRFTRAWQTAYKHLPWWWVAGHVRGGDGDELRSRSAEHTIPLPGTWLAAHEVTRLMHELNRWPELVDAANDQDGAEFIMLFTREVETAAAKWPFSDRTHRVSYFRCEACQQLTLKYFPPNPSERENAPMVDVTYRGRDGKVRKGELLDVVVRCTDGTCNALMSSARFEVAVKLIEWEHEQEKIRAKQRLDSAGGSAGKGGQVESDDSSVAEGGEDSHDAPVGDSVAQLA
jgi:hypothetical protein